MGRASQPEAEIKKEREALGDLVIATDAELVAGPTSNAVVLVQILVAVR